MSFTASSNTTGGMPDINVSMVPVSGGSNYESQGMERAVNIGQDGRPMGKIESIPPFDLLTEENRHIIEQRRMQKEAQKRKEQQKSVPQQKLSSNEILQKANADLIGRTYKYITAENFGKIVSIASCQMRGDELEITMNDGVSILLDELDSMFIYDSYSSMSEEVIETPQQTHKVEEKPKNIQPQKQVEKYQSSLPNSPLRELLSSRKKNPTAMSINLTIDLVKRDFYKIIDDSYENAIDYVVEHVMNNITIEDVKKAIQHELNLYYKNEGRSLTNDEFEEKTIYKEPDMIILEKSE
jgi:hypothetical protein